MFSFNLEICFTFLKCWPSMDWEPVSCGLCVGGRHGAAAGCQKPELPGLRLFNRLGHLFPFSFRLFLLPEKKPRSSNLYSAFWQKCLFRWQVLSLLPTLITCTSNTAHGKLECAILDGKNDIYRHWASWSCHCHVCLSFAKSLQYKLQKSSPLQLNITRLLSPALPIIFKVSQSVKSVGEANQWISPVPQSKTSPVWC